MAEDIFEQVAGELLFTPDRPGIEDAQALPAVAPLPEFDWFHPAAPADDGMVYSRFVPATQPRSVLAQIEDHVRGHLSSVAEADDNPHTRAGDVRIEHVAQDGGTLVVGRLNAQPDAPYLRPGYQPAADGTYTFRRWVPAGVQE